MLIGFVYFIIKHSKTQINLRGLKKYGLGVLIGVLAVIITLVHGKKILNSDSLAERMGIWKNTMALILDNWCVGVGAGNWDTEYAKYGISHIDAVANKSIVFTNAHNEYLELFSELGIGGFLIFILLIVSFFKKSEYINGNPMNSHFINAGIISVLVFSAFSFPLNRPFHVALFFFLLGAKFSRETRLRGYRFTSKAKGLAGVLLIFFLVICSYRIRGEFYARKVHVQIRNSNLDSVEELVSNSESCFYRLDNINKPILYYSYSSNWRNSDSILSNALSKAPFDFEILTMKGISELNKVHLKSSENLFIEALRINKYYELAQINLVRCYINQHQFESAKKVSDAILDFNKKYLRESKILLE